MLILVLLALEIILFVNTYFAVKGDIFRPSMVMLAVFIVSTSIAALNISNWNIQYSVTSVLVITLGLLSAVFADISVPYSEVGTSHTRETQAVEIPAARVIILTIAEILILYLYYKEIVRLATLDGYTPGSNLLWHYRNITSYEATESLGPTVTILTKCVDAISYVITFVLIQNIVVGRMPLRRVLLMAMPIVLFAIKVLMGSGRQELLRWCAFSVVVAYILNSRHRNWTINFSGRFTRKTLVLLPIVFLLFYAATSVIGRATTRSFAEYISTYAGGSIQQFNQYLGDSSRLSSEHLGSETFPGIYSFLNTVGLTDYTRSVHLELRQLGVTQGNVYTFFRRPYNDFGLLGMCLFTFVVVLFFSIWYANLRRRTAGYFTNISIIRYSYLFYWIVLSSVDQYSIGIVSIGTAAVVILIRPVYWFLTRRPHLDWRDRPDLITTENTVHSAALSHAIYKRSPYANHYLGQ